MLHRVLTYLYRQHGDGPCSLEELPAASPLYLNPLHVGNELPLPISQCLSNAKEKPLACGGMPLPSLPSSRGLHPS